MVEVFKTDVANDIQAKNLVWVIERYFDGYKANFDLDDCDRILRVEVKKSIDVNAVVHVLKDMGVKAEVLPDEVESVIHMFEIPHFKDCK